MKEKSNFGVVMDINDAVKAKEEKLKKLFKVMFWNLKEEDTVYLTYFVTAAQWDEINEFCHALGFPINSIPVSEDDSTPIWGE